MRQKIISYLQQFDAEYDPQYNVLILHKEIKVGEFVELKRVLKFLDLKLNDIIVRS